MEKKQAAVKTDKTQFRQLHKKYRKMRKSAQDMPQSFMIRTGIIDERGKISEQGALFADEISEHSFVVRLNRWSAFDRRALFENEAIKGSVFHVFTAVSVFLKRQIVVSKRNFAGGSDYEYSYPVEAINHALYLSFMQADYTASFPITIDVFQNRIEIDFACKGKWQKDRLCHNPVVLEVFRCCRLVQSVQDSLDRIERCYALKTDVRFLCAETDNHTVMVMDSPYYQPVDIQTIKKLRKGTRRCYFMMRKYPGKRLKELSKLLDSPFITVQTEVRQLKRFHLAERRGRSSDGGFYCISAENEAIEKEIAVLADEMAQDI